MVEEKCSDLEKLKIVYEGFKDKYNLPEFSQLNSVFDLEDVDLESDCFLRKVRRAVSEKIVGHLRFIETILNPSNAPMFFFRLLKNVEQEDKEFLNRQLDELSIFEIELIKLDLEYDELKEAEFIKKSYIWFFESKERFSKFLDKLMKHHKSSENNSKSYLG